MKSTRLPKVTHVIFDVDGLIIDSERLYTEVTQRILDEFGKTFTWEMKSKQMGRKETESAKIIIDEMQLPLTVGEYLKRMRVQKEELFPSVPLLPVTNTILNSKVIYGAEKLIRHLHKSKVPIAVATGSDSHGFELKISRHRELFQLFQHIVLNSEDPEVRHGKPAPDCFLVAAKRFPDHPSPERVLVFEDAPNGVEAAHAAGMPCVWVPDPRADKDSLANKATVILDSLEKFVPEDFGLPPYDS
ncbi:hypothetical protein CHS0354_040947 [Potamilus streckersoni]|uniref:pseudouridine 5'-phosphatase n=1 Tax=Potamilus streckersoni TaxID=2493646 RepID=A0AAE0T8G0_9BIVA|nr:hypothetical protein CHS0354_040947 [Potamilus streckersoni]